MPSALFIHSVQASSTLGGLDSTADNIGFIKRNLWGLVGGITAWLFSFLGIIFLALMISGGFMWMTARGNEAQVNKAKELITMAVIGLIIISAAYAITAFIGDFALPFYF